MCAEVGCVLRLETLASRGFICPVEGVRVDAQMQKLECMYLRLFVRQDSLVACRGFALLKNVTMRFRHSSLVCTEGLLF